MAPVAVVVLCGFLIAASAAHADPITVTFTAFPAPGDPVNTGPSMGSFTFDSSLIPPGGGKLQNGFGLGATAIDFRWGSTLFTTANADLGEMEFGSSGQLLSWILGGRATAIFGWVASPASEVVDDIFVSTFTGSTPGGGESINYTLAGIEGLFQGGLITDSPPSPVPEPTSMLLIGSGLVGLALRRSRHKRSDHHSSKSTSIAE
jgi:hypothetical protein